MNYLSKFLFTILSCILITAGYSQKQVTKTSTAKYPQYLDVTVDGKGVMYAIVKTAADKITIQQHDSIHWRDITKDYPGNIVCKILGRSSGIVAMGKSTMAEKEDNSLSVWDGSQWSAIPVSTLKSPIRDFTVTHQDKVWITGAFWDDRRKHYYHLASWYQNQLNIAGPSLVTQESLKPMFDGGGKSIYAIGDNVYLQLYNPSYRSNLTLYVGTNDLQTWRWLSHTSFPIEQDVSVAGVDPFGTLYTVFNCEGTTNRCIALLSGKWKKLPGSNSFINDQINTMCFDDRFNMMIAGKTRTSDDKYVVLRWNGDKFEQYGDGVSAETKKMAWHKNKLYVITGEDASAIQVIYAYNDGWGKIEPIDGPDNGPKTGTSPTTTKGKDLKAAKVWKIYSKYITDEEYNMNLIINSMNNLNTAKDKDRAARDVVTVIGYLQKMLSLTDGYKLLPLNLNSGDNVLADYLRKRMNLLGTYARYSKEAAYAYQYGKQSEFSKNNALANDALEKVRQYVNSNQSLISNYQVRNGL